MLPEIQAKNQRFSNPLRRTAWRDFNRGVMRRRKGQIVNAARSTGTPNYFHNRTRTFNHLFMR